MSRTTLNNSIKLRRLRGATLFESLLYIALFGLIFATLIGFFLFLFQQHLNQNKNIKLYRNVQYLSEHFAESSNDYKVIDKENSDLEIESGKITLRNAEKNKTLIYYVENNSLYVNRNNSINSITVPGIRVEKFLLTPITNSDDEIIGVEINTTLDNGIVKENIKYTYLSYEI